MNLLIIDLETTGLDYQDNGIVSISAKLFNSDRKVVTFYNNTCNPETSRIDLGALKVNRYKIEEINQFKSEKEVLLRFCDWLLGIKVQGELVLGGHNVHFDLGFIKNKLNKYNISGFDQAVSHRTIDTASLGRFLVLTGVLPNAKISLKDLVLALGIDYNPDKAHGSEYDVDLTAKVLFAMVDLVKGKLSESNK